VFILTEGGRERHEEVPVGAMGMNRGGDTYEWRGSSFWDRQEWGDCEKLEPRIRVGQDRPEKSRPGTKEMEEGGEAAFSIA